jgi:hypothetical protein
MMAKDCIGFEDVGSFFGAVGNWLKFRGEATYLIVGGSAVSRLQGASDILYIGQSTRFGGDKSSRLWTYCHPTTKSHEDRLMNVIGDIQANGLMISLHVCQVTPNRQTAKQYESELLRRYKADHLELPPCNFQH